MGARQRSGKSTKASATSAKPTVREPNAKPKTLCQKVLAKDVQLTPREALTAAHWIRQATGVVVGLIFGIAQLTGAPAVLSFLLTTTMAPSGILSLTNELDIEEISQVGSIQMEGLMPSFALFVLTWIVSYTACLPSVEVKGF